MADPTISVAPIGLAPISAGPISVATAALRAEADVWRQQSEVLAGVAAAAEGLRMTSVEAGIFFVLVRAYTQVVDVVSGRCAEGVDRTGEIASTLRQVADVYDQEEADNVHRLTGLS
jgi:hypothetical protein